MTCLLVGAHKGIFTHISEEEAKEKFFEAGNFLVKENVLLESQLENLYRTTMLDEAKVIASEDLISNLPTEQVVNLLSATTKYNCNKPNSIRKWCLDELKRRNPQEFEEAFGEFIDTFGYPELDK
jgi:hypothetical protein